MAVVITMGPSRTERPLKLVQRSLWMVSLFCTLQCLTANSKAHQQHPNGATQKLSVRISTKRTKIQPAEPVRLRVEICNEGSETVYIGANLSGPDNAISTLKVRLFYDGSKVDGSRERSAADYARYRPDDPKKPPFANEFSRYWLTLLPGHFYGGELELDPVSFRKLNISGKYRLQATYTSSGFLTEGMNNPLASYISELGRLPYHAWAGDVESNSIWIEVAKQGGSAK